MAGSIGAFCIGKSADLAFHYCKVDPSLPLQLFQMVCLIVVALSFC